VVFEILIVTFRCSRCLAVIVCSGLCRAVKVRPGDGDDAQSGNPVYGAHRPASAGASLQAVWSVARSPIVTIKLETHGRRGLGAEDSAE
jgi:hypothetical protein